MGVARDSRGSSPHPALVVGPNITMRSLRLSSVPLRLTLLALLLLAAPRSCDSYVWGKCSTTCESKHCWDPLFLRYGKFCGMFYTGCRGQAPCDGLDRCCATHDHCVGHRDYLNVTCNQNLLDCVKAFVNSGAASFPGNTCKVKTAVRTIRYGITAGVWVGRGVGDGRGKNSASEDKTLDFETSEHRSIP